MSKTMREITYRCRNWRCSFTSVATLEFQRVLVLSSIPAADVSLPLSRHIRRGQLALALADEGNVADDEAVYVANLHTPTNDWGNHIAGERTTFRMPECVRIAPATPATTPPANDLDALLARMKAFAPVMRELAAAGR